MPSLRHYDAAIAAAFLTSLSFGQAPLPLEPASQKLLEWSQSHRQLDWKGPGGCVVTFVNTPCRTVHSHSFSFGSGLGFDGITRGETIEAFDQDGSTAKTSTVAKWRLWHLPEPMTKNTLLVLRTENRTIKIDHDRAEFQEYRGGAKGKWPIWEVDDSACSHTKSHYLYLSDRLPDAVVAGVHVVGYSGQDERGADYEIFFAPSLGCQQMKFQVSKRIRIGLKVAQYEMVVDSFELGPPSRTLFTVPSGYRRVEP